ncbi:1-phosphofructokinase family hexose kinase [Limibacillus halophilus]|jgi:6-phosphofructokinase 2
MTDILTITFNPALDLTTSIGRLAPHVKLRCEGLRRDPGGGGINVARAVLRMGGQARALFPAGGSPGQRVRELLEAEGVDCLVVDSAAETREDLTVQELESGLQYRFLLPGEPLPEGAWQACLDLLEALSPAPRFLVASGSLPPGAPDDLLARVARLARRRGIDFVVDSSGPPLRLALEEGLALAKMNRRELAEISGLAEADEGALRLAANSLIGRGKLGALLLTLADKGADLFLAESAWHADAPAVELVSAVGAGDSALAAYLCASLRGESPETALGWAVAAGTAALLTPGTELCRLEDVERMRQQVQVTRLP